LGLLKENKMTDINYDVLQKYLSDEFTQEFNEHESIYFHVYIDDGLYDKPTFFSTMPGGVLEDLDAYTYRSSLEVNEENLKLLAPIARELIDIQKQEDKLRIKRTELLEALYELGDFK